MATSGPGRNVRPVADEAHAAKRKRDDVIADASLTGQPRQQPGLVPLFGSINAHCFHGVGVDKPAKESLISILDHKQFQSVTLSGISSSPFLPEFAQVATIVESAFNNVFSYWPILDRAAFDRIFKALYKTQPFGQNKIRWDDLALMYAVLALGQFVHNDSQSFVWPSAHRTTDQERLWFQKAVSLVPPQQCARSVSALHTIMCAALYLLLSGSLTQCDEFMAHASNAILSMGLHQAPSSALSEQETLSGYRTYLSCQLLDSYMAMLIGQPRRLPMRSTAGMITPPESTKGLVEPSAINALRVETQLSKIVNDFRDSGPLPGDPLSTSNAQAGLASVETALKSWYNDHIQKPAAEHSQTEAHDLAKLRLLLAYGRCTMIVYYPFLEQAFTTKQSTNEEILLARRCIEAASVIVDASRRMAAAGGTPACTVHILAFAATALLTVEVARPFGEKMFDNGRPRHTAREACDLLRAVAVAHPGAQEYTSMMASIYDYVSDWHA